MADVTQADREAAADVWPFVLDGMMPSDVIEGRHDKHYLVQAFAAHRIAAEQATVEKIAEWLRETAPQYSHNELATLIEQGDWRND